MSDLDLGKIKNRGFFQHLLENRNQTVLEREERQLIDEFQVVSNLVALARGREEDGQHLEFLQTHARHLVNQLKKRKLMLYVRNGNDDCCVFDDLGLL